SARAPPPAPERGYGLPLRLTAGDTSPLSPLSLHDALPILRASTTSNTTSSFAAASASCVRRLRSCASAALSDSPQASDAALAQEDRESTRLNSSHVATSYAGFRLKENKHPSAGCDAELRGD